MHRARRWSRFRNKAAAALSSCWSCYFVGRPLSIVAAVVATARVVVDVDFIALLVGVGLACCSCQAAWVRSTAGGALTMEACSAAAEAGDGRSVFLLKSNGQLQMPRLGDFCLSMAGDGAVEANVALGADVAATSSNAQHAAKGAIDGDDHSFWASAVDPASSVDMNIDFGATKIFRTVEIDWEYPAQVFPICSTWVNAVGFSPE